MSSALHVRSMDVGGAPAFGALTDLRQLPVPAQAAGAQLSRDAFGRWSGTPAAFGMRTTPLLGARGHTDSLRVSQTVDVITLLLATGAGGVLRVQPTAMVVPAGVHTARFIKVNPSGLPQVVSPWFAARVPVDAHEVHDALAAGALAAGLELGTYAQCVVLLALPIAAQVAALDDEGRPVLTPLHPITGAPDASLAFAVADHARSFADTPLLLRHAAVDHFGTLERVGVELDDARARFVQSHGPVLDVAVGDVVELVRYRDAMAFDTDALDDAPIAFEYAYVRTVELRGAEAVVFDDIARADGPAVVYNVYCERPYELSADGVAWSPVVRSAHLATRARAPLHVRLVDADGAAPPTPLTLARYVLGVDPTTMHLVYERAQTVGVSTFGDAPTTGELAAVGPFTLYADAHARNALETVPTGAFLHGDRSIVVPTPLRGACLHVADARASRLAPYTGTNPRFASRTTIGGLTLGSGTQDLLFQAPEMRVIAAEGRVQGLRVTGALTGGSGAPFDGTPVGAVVATSAVTAPSPTVATLASVTVVPPTPNPYSMVPSTWEFEMRMVRGAIEVSLEESGGDYTFAGTTTPTNPTIYAFGNVMLMRISAGRGFTVHLDDVLQTLPLTIVRTAPLAYKLNGVLKGQIIARENTTLELLTEEFIFQPSTADLTKLRFQYMDSSGRDSGPLAANHATLTVTRMLRDDDCFTTTSTTSSATAGVTTISNVWGSNMHTFAFRIYLPSAALAAAITANQTLSLVSIGTDANYKPGGRPAFLRWVASKLRISATGKFQHNIYNWYREYPMFPTDEWVHIVCASRANVWYNGVSIPLEKEVNKFPTGQVGGSSRRPRVTIGGSTQPGMRFKELMVFEGHQISKVR